MATNAIAVPLPATTEARRPNRVEREDGFDSPVDLTKSVKLMAETLNELDQTLDRPSDSGDDLQQIRGIGQATAQAMNNVGIYRYADLVRFTPESLADLLQTEIPSVSPKRIERDDWIDQAKALAQPANTEGKPTEEEEEEEEEEEAAAAEVAMEPEEEAPSFPRWQQHAGFSVFFDYLIDKKGEQLWQTRAYHDETGEEILFPGVAVTPWANWVMEKAKLPAKSMPPVAEEVPEPILVETEVAAPAAAEEMPFDAQLEILEVQVSETEPSSDVPEKRLKARVRFQVVGPEAEIVAAELIPFRIEVHTVDIKSGASGLLASGDSELQPRVFEYTSEQTFPIPEVGRYQLHTIVLLRPPGDLMTYHRGPTINVVP